MEYVLGFLVSTFVVAIVAAPLFRERRLWVATAPHTRRALLLEQRDTALRELKDLEFDRRMGKIDDADYSELRASAASRATEVLDALEALKPSGRGQNGSSNASWLRALDAEAEILVARARLRLKGATQTDTSNGSQSDSWLCECGRSMKSSDKFCASCGATRPQV